MKKKLPIHPMLKRGLISYWKSIHYYFVPLGTLTIAVIIGLSIALPSSAQAIRLIFTRLAENSGEQFDMSTAIDLLIESITGMDWAGNPMGSALSLLKGGYLTSLLQQIATQLFGDESVTPEVSALIQDAINVIQSGAVGLAIFLEVGLISGYMIVKANIRKQICKRSIWKTLLITGIDAIINALVVTGIVFLLTLWKVSAAISIPVAFVISALITLFEAYLVHGWKKIPLKQVMHPKNILFLFLTDLIFLAIGVTITLLLLFLTNVIAGLFLSIPFLEITFIMIELNAESYVAEEAAKTVGCEIPK